MLGSCTAHVTGAEHPDGAVTGSGGRGGSLGGPGGSGQAGGTAGKGGNAGNSGSSGQAGTSGAGGGPAADCAVRTPVPAVVYPLKLAASRRCVVDQGGNPFLITGDSPWSLIVQLTREDAELYLENRRARGFNLLLVELIEHHFSNNPPNNVYGQGPFTTPGDFATPNEQYFAHADWVLERARQKGMVVLLAPAYIGFGGGVEGWYQEMVANGATKLRNYGRYVGNRYRAQDNIIWLNGGDYTPPASGIALVNAVAEGIKAVDTRHLHAAHWGRGTSGATVSAGNWLDLDTTYNGSQPVYQLSLQDYRRNDGRPHFLLEAYYENENGATSRSLRGQAYYALLTGAIGQIFGNRDVWPFNASWKAALDSRGAVSMGQIPKLFGARQWANLIPDETNRVLVAGQGSKGSFDYAVLASSSDERLAVAYVPTVRSVSVDLSRLTRPLRARWFDPTNGAFTEVSGSPFNVTGSRGFAPPGSNAAGDSDWVLLLEAGT
jgi:hypothetical protein